MLPKILLPQKNVFFKRLVDFASARVMHAAPTVVRAGQQKHSWRFNSITAAHLARTSSHSKEC